MQTNEVTTTAELALLVDAVQDYALFMLAPDGVVRSWNAGAERTFGYKADEVIGRNFSMFYPENLKERPIEELRIAADSGRVEDEGWRQRRDGELFWVNTIITALRTKDGALHGFAKVTRDLTERREADEQLRQSEEMFRLLVTSVAEYAIFMLDPTGHVVTWNAGAQRIKGYSPDEIIGTHFSAFYPEEDKGKTERELDIAKRDGLVEDEGWRLRKDGTRFWANVVITAIYDRRGALRGFTKVTRDMTERREAELTRRALLEQREARLIAEQERRQAEASYRAAQETNRIKDEFLMTLSHELRTPMTAIVGWSRLLSHTAVDDPMMPEGIAAISRSARHQARLIDDVLDVSRIVSGKLRLILDTVDIAPLLDAGVETVKAAADAKGISLETSFDADLGRLVIDPTRFQQMVWNLLMNAVKFTPKRGRVRLTAERTASQLEVRVIDSGEGIDLDFLPHIFEPFRQSESSTTRTHGGLGLGLSIVRYLAEAHGGSVSAGSEGRGKGAAFTLSLPIRAVALHAENHEVAEREETTRDVPVALKGLRILLVDDDDEGRTFVRAALRRGGAEVADVNSADAALLRLDSETFDIIISDIAMPGMDGFAFGEELRRRDDTRSKGLIALSAFSSSPHGTAASAFDRYLSKPIDPVDLVEAVEQVWKQRGTSGE